MLLAASVSQWCCLSLCKLCILTLLGIARKNDHRSFFIRQKLLPL